jgi:hypothetical protein
MPSLRTGSKGGLRPLRSIRADLDSLSRHLGLEGGLKLYRLQSEWRALFHQGPLSFHTWPGQFKDGRLTVFADSSPWLQQAAFLKQDILLKLKPFGILGITFRISRRPDRQFPENGMNKEPENELSSQESNAIEEMVSALDDDELKGQIRRAIRAWARRRRRQGFQL